MKEEPSNYKHWSDEEIAKLREHWAKGYSAGQIARKLPGKSRNAVIGKIHRLGIQRGKVINRSPYEIGRRMKGKHIRPRPTKLKPPILASVALPAGALPPLKVDVMGLERGMCRWPVSEERPHLFCGHACAEGDSYCSAHMRMAHRDEPPGPLEKYADWLTRHEYRTAA